MPHLGHGAGGASLSPDDGRYEIFPRRSWGGDAASGRAGSHECHDGGGARAHARDWRPQSPWGAGSYDPAAIFPRGATDRCSQRWDWLGRGLWNLLAGRSAADARILCRVVADMEVGVDGVWAAGRHRRTLRVVSGAEGSIGGSN